LGIAKLSKSHVMQVSTNLLTAELVEGCRIHRKHFFFPTRFGNKKNIVYVFDRIIYDVFGE